MSADKRALDDLDALFRAVPAQATSASRPGKRPRSGRANAGSSKGAAQSNCSCCRHRPSVAAVAHIHKSGEGGKAAHCWLLNEKTLHVGCGLEIKGKTTCFDFEGIASPQRG